MDDVNHESSVDFSDEFEYSYDDASGGYFDNEDDQVEYKCDLLSNSSTSSCYPESDDDEVRRRDIEEFSMDIHDSTNDSVQPIEENNNDPNNNMEGGEEFQEENEEPNQSQAVQIIRRPVSPQPGCSKHFDFIENGDFVTREDHRTAVRIQDYLHKIDYLTVIRAHQKRPDLEQHLYRLFDNCTSVKRPYEDTLGDMEKNKKPGKRRLQAKDEDEHNDTIVIESPESYRDANDISFDRRLSPDDHSKKKENQNVIPIDIDFSDEEIVIEEPNINETKGPTNYHSSNNPKELKAHLPLIQPSRFENREASQERKSSLKKDKFAPSTIVREEQATPITSAVTSTYNPTLKMPGREGLLPATITKLATAKSSQRPIPSASGASTSFTQNPLSPTLISGYVHGKSGTRVMTAQREHNYKSNRRISPIRLNGTRPMTVQREYSPPALPPSPPPAPGPSRGTMAIHVHDPQAAERIHHREFGNENAHVGVKRTSEMPPLESHSDIKRRRDMTIDLDTIVINESTPDIPNNNGKYCREIYTKLRAMFPNINKNYIKKMIPAEWSANVSHDVQFGQIVEQLLANEPNWELDIPTVDANEQQGAGGSTALTVDETYEHLLEIFSNADPTFLRSSAEAMHNNHVALANFIERYSQKQDYPTKEEYLSKMRITEEQLRYTDNFTVAEFLEKFPDPSKHFMDSTRKCKYELVAFEFLKSKFNKIRVNTISQVYNKHSYNMSIAASELAKIKCNMCSTRKHPEMPTNDINILQEIAFIRHREQIEDYLAKKDKAEKDEYERLKKENGLLECQCCYDNECMPSKCASCENGHIFCYSCIIGGTDSRLGDGETHVPCFQGCGSEFSLATLQSVLKPTKFSILVKKRQAAEVAAAGVEGLVSCPFCHFASIPPEGDKVFKCLNPECMKESCIQCKEPNHVPLRCEEVGRADRARKYIEEKMTEALARKCYQCKRAYFKEEGCNKITCPCGAMMCYLCDKKIQDYTHFRGQGCDDMSKCPLYSDNARLNAEKVRKMAQAAKKEMLEQDPSLRIETDHLLPAVPPPSAGPHEQIVQALIPPIAMGVIPMMPMFPEMPPHLPRVRVAHQPRGVYHHHGNPPAPPPQAQYREAYHPPH